MKIQLPLQTLAITAALALLARSAWGKAPAAEQRAGDCVVLLHGLGRSAWSMKRLEWALRKENYQVINRSYPSTRLSVAEAAAWLDDVLKDRPAGAGQIHFVTHSLGGIVLRQYLAERPIENLGRVVMLAPPNQGSELADKLKPNALYRFFTGPGGQQLGTDAASLPRQLPPADFDLGVVAGDRSLNPLFSNYLPGPDDGKVTVASTRLAGMRDFLVVHHSHTWLAWTRPVTIAVKQFLKSGQFDRIDPLPAPQSDKPI